jgi:DNA-binding transcriptional ArsR family regulator
MSNTKLARRENESRSRVSGAANKHRLGILFWLQNSRGHFSPQIAGDLVRDGVCGCLIAKKLRVSHPTASEHLKILSQAGLIRGKRIKQWTFYKRDESTIRKIKKTVFPNV